MYIQVLTYIYLRIFTLRRFRGIALAEFSRSTYKNLRKCLQKLAEVSGLGIVDWQK